jgi:hypothetical protein
MFGFFLSAWLDGLCSDRVVYGLGVLHFPLDRAYMTVESKSRRGLSAFSAGLLYSMHMDSAICICAQPRCSICGLFH